MPRGRLNEKTVQRASVQWLREYYVNKLSVCSITTAEEAVVCKNSRKGNGRADGLIAARLDDGSIFTAALEAKSSRTFSQLTPTYQDSKWMRHAGLLSVLFALSVFIFAWFILDHWFWIWIFPFLIFLLSAVAFLIVTAELKSYRPIDVIQQVLKYPGNERWIAISSDAFYRLSSQSRSVLIKDCEQEGIGLIRVSTSQKIFVLQEARPKNKQQTNYLECYARRKRIYQKLNTPPINKAQQII